MRSFRSTLSIIAVALVAFPNDALGYPSRIEISYSNLKSTTSVSSNPAHLSPTRSTGDATQSPTEARNKVYNAVGTSALTSTQIESSTISRVSSTNAHSSNTSPSSTWSQTPISPTVPTPYTIETLLGTTHTGLKPYVIQTAGSSNNPNSTFRPSWITDDEPLSCYPPFLLSSQSPKFWGTEGIPNNRCFTKKANGCKDWNGAARCMMRPGEVKLLYFPPNTAELNQKEAITKAPVMTAYNKFYDYTFTSPSVYILYHRIAAWDGCSQNQQLGPHITSAFFPYRPEDISTLIPQTTYTGNEFLSARKLDLNDIISGCSTLTFDSISAIANTRPVVGDIGYRCFPRLVIPSGVNDFGKPWWNNCATYSAYTGLVDPPYALTIGAGLAALPPAPAPVPENPENSAIVLIETAPVPATPTPVPSKPPTPAAIPDAALSTPTGHPNVPDTPPAQQPASGDNSQANNQPGESASIPPASGNQPVAGVTVSVIATAIVAAPPEQSGTEIKPAALNQPGAPTINSPSDPEAQIYNAASTLAPISGDETPNLAIPVPIDHHKTDGSANVPATVLYMHKTLVQGGPVVTISSINAVVSYGASGIIVQYPGGVVSTITIAATTVTNSGVIPTTTRIASVQNAAAGAASSSATALLNAATTLPADHNEAADIASFINFVMAGEPARGAETNETSGTGNKPDATASPVLFTGNAHSIRVCGPQGYIVAFLVFIVITCI